MALIVHACENLLRHYEVARSKHVEKSGKMEGICWWGRDGLRGSWWNEGVKPSDVRSSVICSLWRFRACMRHCVYGVANSVKLHAQVAVRGLYRNTAKEWFRGVIRNLPSTRWCTDLGREFTDLILLEQSA
jgi:hypothetical protein